MLSIGKSITVVQFKTKIKQKAIIVYFLEDILLLQANSLETPESLSPAESSEVNATQRK